nr:hypothetical protein [uncultured Carboxylicivirga sp.]
MARQKGIIKLEGRIGDLSFYKSGNDYLARSKGGVEGDRIKNDPAYARTRENGQEFGRAGKAGKLIRNALKVPIKKAADNKVSSRLAALVLKAIQADTTNARGERTVIDGDLSLLQGFEFNAKQSLESIVTAPFTIAIDRAAGTFTVNVQEFVPTTEIAVVEGATHLQFIAAAAAIDFTNGSYEVDVAESAEIVIGTDAQAALNIAGALSADSPNPILMVFGVEFYQLVNGAMYPLNNNASNPLAMVAVDVV